MGPTIDKIRGLCTESSFERGLEYFQQGRVTDLKQFGKRIMATVAGTDDYKVTIHTDTEDIEASCTCPYDWGGYCKHIVATLIALSEDYRKVKRKGEKEEQKIEAILNNLFLDELRRFLMAEFEKNPSLREHFTIYFSGKGSKRRSIHDYKREINLLYREADGRHGYIEYGNEINFSYICDLADRYLRAGNPLEAASIYQALSEVIAKNMENVDDSDGYYGGEFDQAIESFTACINEAGLDHKEKRHYIDYFFAKYIENDPDYFQANYDCALREICQSREDLEYWKGLLEPHLPGDLPDQNQWIMHYQAERLIRMQLYILDKVNDKEGFYDLVQRYYCKGRDFCLLYAHRLERDGRSREAVKIAEEGLCLFPDHLTKELRRFLNRFYETEFPQRYKQNLITLFVQDRQWSDYDRLKELCSQEEQEEWDRVFSAIISELSKGRFGSKDTIIHIYLREGMFAQALEQVLAQRSLSTLSHYHKELSVRYPEEYFNACKELIMPFAESRTGRPHYRSIVGYLRQMKQIEGFEDEFKELVSLLKNKYSNRPAFLDEMRDI